jgi:hypothetical protein
LLQRLGKLLFQVGVAIANVPNVSFRLRSRRTNTASLRSALRPFASQDHLVGTVTGPGGPTKDHVVSFDRIAFRPLPAGAGLQDKSNWQWSVRRHLVAPRSSTAL